MRFRSRLGGMDDFKGQTMNKHALLLTSMPAALPGKRSTLAAIIALSLAGLVTPQQAEAKVTILHAGRLVDGDGTERSQVSVIVDEDRIVDVQPGFATQAGADVLDLSNATVLPGLVNAHVHLQLRSENAINPGDGRPETLIDFAMEALPNFRAFAMEGFTTVRNMSSLGGVDLALKRAARDSYVVGPRVLASLEAISPTGGHGDFRNQAASGATNPYWMPAIADGPAEVAKAVREHRQRGADVIKIMPSGGVTSVGDDPNQQVMTNEEIAAAVQTAHALGLKVAAHAQSDLAISNAARLGVDSIEHGTLASETTMKLMKEKGTFLIPTMSVGAMFARRIATDPNGDPHRSGKMMEMWNAKLASVRMAYKIGVRMALGTDVDAAHSEMEFGLLRDAGVPNAEIIRQATSRGAELLGMSNSIGMIKAGYLADLIAVPSDPLADIEALRDVRFVMLGGVIIKHTM